MQDLSRIDGGGGYWDVAELQGTCLTRLGSWTPFPAPKPNRSLNEITAPSEESKDQLAVYVLRPAERVPGFNKREETQGTPCPAKPQGQPRLLRKMGGDLYPSAARQSFLLKMNSSGYWLLWNERLGLIPVNFSDPSHKPFPAINVLLNSSWTP